MILTSGPIKTAFVNVTAGATASTVVAAVSGARIRVHALAMVSGATATNVTFNSASAAISCLFANGANSGAVLPELSTGWFQTVTGEALTVTTGTGATTGIQVSYSEA